MTLSVVIRAVVIRRLGDAGAFDGQKRFSNVNTKVLAGYARQVNIDIEVLC